MAKAFDLRYPIYSSGRFMRTGKDRVEVADVQVAVALGDAQVRPGDLVVGDDDGIVVIAQGHEERVLQVAREIVEQQDHIIEEVLAGSKIADARARHGYHVLQRAEEPEDVVLRVGGRPALTRSTSLCTFCLVRGRAVLAGSFRPGLTWRREKSPRG